MQARWEEKKELVLDVYWPDRMDEWREQPSPAAGSSGLIPLAPAEP